MRSFGLIISHYRSAGGDRSTGIREVGHLAPGQLITIYMYTPTQVFLDALRVVNRADSLLALVAATSLQEAPARAAMGCPLSV